MGPADTVLENSCSSDPEKRCLCLLLGGCCLLRCSYNSRNLWSGGLNWHPLGPMLGSWFIGCQACCQCCSKHHPYQQRLHRSFSYPTELSLLPHRPFLVNPPQIS
jgi:hypothetical protein